MQQLSYTEWSFHSGSLFANLTDRNFKVKGTGHSCCQRPVFSLGAKHMNKITNLYKFGAQLIKVAREKKTNLVAHMMCFQVHKQILQLKYFDI